MTTYAPLPTPLTAPLPLPPPPPRHCKYKGGTPAVCALDGLLWQVQLQTQLQRANADRESAGKLSTDARLNSRDGVVKP